MVMKKEGAAEVGNRPPPTGDRALRVRRLCSDRLLLHRLHQNILYLKLRSLLPVTNGREPSEGLPDPDELPRGVSSDNESKGKGRRPCLLGIGTKENNSCCNEEGNDCFINNNREDDDEEARRKEFVPTIKVRVPPELDVDTLKAKLEAWAAGKEPPN